MTRRSIEERINALDLATCQQVLLMISKGDNIDVALKNAKPIFRELLDFLSEKYPNGCAGVRCDECALQEHESICNEMAYRGARK